MIPGNNFKEITGTREEVESQMKSLADRNCRRCYGRGHLGFNLTWGTFAACRCVSRNLARTTVKSKRGACMIVMYSLPNMLTIPYKIDGKKGNYTFIPGKNQIPDKIWKAIVSQNKTRFDNYYSSVLREFKPAPEAIKSSSGEGATSGETLVDISRVEVQQALDLIENTMELDDLETYLKDEKQLKKPRKAVVKAITGKIAEISNFTARIKEKKGTVEVT